MNEDTPRDPAQEQEWIRQNNVLYGGFIVLGVYVMQPFLIAGSLDTLDKLTVVAFAVAIPLLAALVMLNQQEGFRQRLSRSVMVNLARTVAMVLVFAGSVLAVWNIDWVAGVAAMVAIVAGVVVHSAGYVRLEAAIAPTPEAGEEPGSDAS